MAGRETRNSYYMSRPSERGGSGSRAVGSLILTLLCPPIGLLYLWRNGIFRSRGRLTLTLIATVEMTVLICIVLPKASTSTVLPAASFPGYVTSAPVDDVSNALTNLEALLGDDYVEPTQEPMDEMERALQEAAEKAAVNELLDNTIVYSVYSGAKYYHAVPECGQMNNREMTLREALAEKLGACNICNPPYVS